MTTIRNAYLALGSNLGDRTANILRAAAAIGAEIGEVEAFSKIYSTAPLSLPGMAIELQLDFLNAVLHCRTPLAPGEIMDKIASIEEAVGRERQLEVRWGPRVIDIDLLLLDDLIVKEGGIRVPHPGMCQRDFVLKPLCEIAPHLLHPENGTSIERLLCELIESGAPLFVKGLAG